MLEPYHSRTDMSIEDIMKKINHIKKDHRFPKALKPLEIKRLNAMLKWANGDWTVRPPHESDAPVDYARPVAYNNHSNHDGQQGAINAYHADSRWYLRRRPRLYS